MESLIPHFMDVSTPSSSPSSSSSSSSSSSYVSSPSDSPSPAVSASAFSNATQLFFEPQLNVRICRENDEDVSQPKFSFVLGEKLLIGNFTYTKQSTQILRLLFQRQACRCGPTYVSSFEHLWDLMDRIGRECFWICDSFDNLRHFRSSSIVEADVPLHFDTYGLFLLSLTQDDSFLHINCGTGYACTIAGHLLGANKRNHGVEFRGKHRQQAKTNRENMLRFRPGIEEEAALPVYHAGFPVDLLEGKSEFNKVLVTDCFYNLQDVYELKRLLTPNGILVTSFVNYNDNNNLEFCMVTLKRHDDTEENKENSNNGCEASHMFHALKPGMFRHILRAIRREKLNTISRLDVARLNTGALSESAIPSLQILSLRALAKLSDPIRPLLGDSPCLYRLPVRGQYPTSLSTQLGFLLAAFSSLQTHCLVAKVDASDSGVEDVKEEVANVAAALESLGKRFVGRQQYSLWKNGEAVQLPVQQGVMVWILENIFHLVRYSWSDYRICRNARSNFMSLPPDWNVQADATSTVTVMQPLLKAFLQAFRTVDVRYVSNHRPPWNHQLSYAKQMKRILTKLAARFWADIWYYVNSTRVMVRFCETLTEQSFWCSSSIKDDIQRCETLLHQLCEKVLLNSESFTSIQAFQEEFSKLTPYVRPLHHDVSFLTTVGLRVSTIQQLASCLCIIESSALRNLVGSGRVQRCSDPSLQLEFVNREGSLMNSSLFHTEVTFLVGHGFKSENPVEDACDFLVRRFLTDMADAVWMSTSVQSDMTLLLLEKDASTYYREILKEQLPIPRLQKIFGSLS